MIVIYKCLVQRGVEMGKTVYWFIKNVMPLDANLVII